MGHDASWLRVAADWAMEQYPAVMKPTYTGHRCRHSAAHSTWLFTGTLLCHASV